MQKSTKLLLGATVAVGVGVALFVVVLDRLTNDSREVALRIYESMQNSLGENVAAGQDRLRSVIDDPRALSGENCHLPLSEELEKYKEHHDVFLRIKPDGMLDCTPAGPVDKEATGDPYLDADAQALTLDCTTSSALAAWRKFRCSATVSVWISNARGMREPGEVGTPQSLGLIVVAALITVRT